MTGAKFSAPGTPYCIGSVAKDVEHARRREMELAINRIPIRFWRSMGKEMGKAANREMMRLDLTCRKPVVGPPGFEPGTNGL